MASAQFTVEGGDPAGGVTATAAQEINLALSSVSDVRSVVWSVLGSSDPAVTDPVISTAGTPDGVTASFTMPTPDDATVGYSLIVRCVVNGGLSGGVVDADLTFSAIIGVVSASGFIPFSYGETTESSITHSITDKLNNRLETFAGGGEANTTSNEGGGDASLALTKSGSNLPFRTVSGTGGVTVTENGNVVEIDGSGVAGGDPSPLTTKGDVYTYDTDDARLPVGSNGEALLANSGTATGLEWGAPAPAAHTLGGAAHTADTLANLNTKVSDATLGGLTSSAPANVTKAAAAVGVATDVARADHKHDVTTAAPAATGVATASGEGSATTLARSDHSHQSNTAPVNVTKAAAAIGTSGQPARADHKHDVTTAAAVELTDSTNAEGAATSLARSNHTHAHGNRGGGTLHATGTIATQGFLKADTEVSLTPNNTTADGDAASASAIGFTPGAQLPQVFVNGQRITVGTTAATAPCYFSADGGTTARAAGAVINTDLLYWNGTVTGFQLSSTHELIIRGPAA